MVSGGVWPWTDYTPIAFKAKKGKQWFGVVNGAPSANGFDRIISAHADKASFVFRAADSLYYVAKMDIMFVLVDERIEARAAEAK